MSQALYNDLAGLRFWNDRELRERKAIKEALVSCVFRTITDLNQMWHFEEVETPLMMPLARMSSAYDRSDIFMLMDPPGGTEPFAMRAETTDGTYVMATHLLRSTNKKPPVCFYQEGKSFRRETSDGATAAKLRFNAFTQLEFQMIHSVDTKVDFVTPMRFNLLGLVAKLTGRQTRTIPSDRLPAYSTETVDIEVQTDTNEWREVASTSRRTDFPQIPGFKPLQVFEIAFGLDRMVALSI